MDKHDAYYFAIMAFLGIILGICASSLDRIKNIENTLSTMQSQLIYIKAKYDQYH